MQLSLTVSNLYPMFLAALCTWREAQNQSTETQRGVIWTIKNRASVAAWWNHNKANDPVAVILMPEQYSSFNHNDPNATKFPSSTDAVFQAIKLLVIDPGEDPTGGATHYFDKSLDGNPPGWAAEMQHVCDIGAMRFYK
jgi:hypothetical protein